MEDGDTAESKGEGLYWRYESAIKKAIVHLIVSWEPQESW